jgi:hypothetical protein
MTNPNDNSKASASRTRPTFGYILTLFSFFWFMFNSGLNMNTCTCLVSLTIMISLRKYLFNCGIKICHNLAYYLTIQKTFDIDRMTSEASIVRAMKPKPFDGSKFKRW